MACYSPLTGTRTPSGAIKFRANSSTPKAWMSDTGANVTVSCGQCIGCRLEHSRQWAARCLFEASTHTRNCFITLTYAPAHLPANGTLVLRDWQLFAKALRNAGYKFRFFHCGEYGENTERPHYHACIFGEDFSSDRIPWKRTKHRHQLYTSEALSTAWGKGFCSIGGLTFESAAYVARYCLKKRTGEAAHVYNVIDYSSGELLAERRPEYTTMSRNPGLGKAWWEQFKSDVINNDFILVNGRKCRPPPYYDYLYEMEDPEAALLVKAQRTRAARAHEENNSPQRLAIRERITRRKISLLPRPSI